MRRQGPPPLARLKARFADQRWLVRAWGETLPLRRRVFGALRKDTIAFLHVGRCGSTVLFLMLRKHPDLYAHGELWQRYCAATSGPWLPELERVVYRAPYRRFWFATKLLAKCDLERLGTTMPAYFDALDDVGCTRFVGLGRRNLLRRDVSSAVAAARDTWHTKQPLADIRVTLPIAGGLRNQQPRLPLVERLARNVADSESLRRAVEARGGLWLVYEDDVMRDPQRGYRRICEHLGIAAVPTNVPLKRTTDAPLDAVLSNYDEVAAALDGTPYAWMLTAD